MFKVFDALPMFFRCNKYFRTSRFEGEDVVFKLPALLRKFRKSTHALAYVLRVDGANAANTPSIISSSEGSKDALGKAAAIVPPLALTSGNDPSGYETEHPQCHC